KCGIGRASMPPTSDPQAYCNYWHIISRTGRASFAERNVSELTSSRAGGVRGTWKPTGWDRTRLGVLVPLGVVVAVAIVCIVVAALTSAQRADEVAGARE